MSHPKCDHCGGTDCSYHWGSDVNPPHIVREMTCRKTGKDWSYLYK